MTTDDAAKLLATYQLTGSVRKTARELHLAPMTVSNRLKAAGVAVKPEPVSLVGTKKGHPPYDWTAAYSQRETALLNLVDGHIEANDFRVRDLVGAVKIIGDARYREQHPEFQGNRTVIDQSQHVHVTTNEALAALREAKTLLPDGR